MLHSRAAFSVRKFSWGRGSWVLQSYRIVLLLLAGLAWLVEAQSAQAIDFSTVESAGNAADPITGLGSVASVYRIGATEVTNLQYTDFLNAVAATDPHGLYDSGMASDSTNGGIFRSGEPSSFAYTAKPGFENKPVTHVSFWSAIRFANWMNNGMGGSSTEIGAYTLTAASIAANTVERNSGASVFLPSEDEWYKAAYYDPVSDGYFTFPTGTNSTPDCAGPGANPNTANCEWWTSPSRTVNVAGYTHSTSPSGTYDQGGNVNEWTEGLYSTSPGALDERQLRGGNFDFNALELRSTYSRHLTPGSTEGRTGFRIASAIPEPGTGTLLGLGLTWSCLIRQRGRTS